MCLSLWPNSPFCKGSSHAGLRLTPLPHFELITLCTLTFHQQDSHTEILRICSVHFSLKRTQVNLLSHNYYFSVNFSFNKRELNQAYVVNLSAWEAKVGGYLWVLGQTDLHNKFWTSQQYTIRPWLKQNKTPPPSKKGRKKDILFSVPLSWSFDFDFCFLESYYLEQLRSPISSIDYVTVIPLPLLPRKEETAHRLSFWCPSPPHRRTVFQDWTGP